MGWKKWYVRGIKQDGVLLNCIESGNPFHARIPDGKNANLHVFVLANGIRKTARDRGNIAIRIGKLYSTLPHCLRKLPENQPRNRQEYMIRKWMNPSEIEVYFDASNKYLYEARTMAQQMEEIKKDRRKLMEMCREQMKILKAVIVKEPPPPQMDIAAMRKRFDTAVKEHAKTEAKKRGKQMSH